VRKTGGGGGRNLTRMLPGELFPTPSVFSDKSDIGPAPPARLEGRSMKTVAMWMALLGCFQASSQPFSAQGAGPIWIADATIISPENLGRIETGSVLIEGGRIVRVERKAGVPVPEHATVVSGKGQFLIPGLIDSHVHLATVPGMDFDQLPRSGIREKYYEQMPRSYLYYGYTTLIDLSVFEPQVLIDFRRAPLHPDLHDCGGSLPFANGYPMSFVPGEARFRYFPNFIYDPAQAASIPREYKPEDHTPAAAVRRVKASGALCVKTYFERGFGPDRNLPVMSLELLSQIRKSATENGLVLMLHANAYEAQKFGVAGNVDVLAHGMWNWGGDLARQPGLPDPVRQVLDEIVEKKIGYQATIQVLSGLGAYFDADYLRQPALAKVVPPALLAWFRSPDGKWFKKDLGDTDEPDAARLEDLEQGPFRRVRLVASYLAGKDANFLFGTDTPSAPTYGNLPGLNGYLEMQQLEKAGLSLEQIFQAATLRNAQEFKLDTEVGTIEPGKIANLLLLRKSPLVSLDAYDSISTVWVHGVAVDRERLAADSRK
jgi:Amidohydrolase family